MVVVDDASTDATALAAPRRRCGRRQLPFNVGIGGAVQTGYRFARDEGSTWRSGSTGTDSMTPDIPLLLAPFERDEADMVVGSRFVGRAYLPGAAGAPDRDTHLRPSRVAARRPACHRHHAGSGRSTAGIPFFAAEYPPDYPEVESTVIVHWSADFRQSRSRS